LPLVASFVGGGLPIGMLTLAVLLLIRSQNGSFLGAGLMAAALSVGNAVGVAVQGALIDRPGQTAVLVPASLICLSSLIGLVFAAASGAPPALTAGLAVTGGAAIPATPSSMRALWPTLVPDPQLRLTAYALSAVSFPGSYALLVSCGLAGSAAGYAVGGILVSAAGITHTFLAAAAAGTAAAGWYARRRRTLAPHQHVRCPESPS
jgi:MFS family permease